MSERSTARAEINIRVRDINARLSTWLRRERVGRGLTQREAGELIGVSYQQWHKYESEQNGLSAAKLLLVTQALQVDLGTLAEAAFGAPPPAPARRQSRIERRLHERIAALTPGQQQGVLSMLEVLGQDTPRSWLTPELVAC